MWYGKLAVIIYVFCFSMIFATLFANQIFQDPVYNNTVLFTQIASISQSFQPSIVPLPELIFGDFISVFKILGTLLTGEVFLDVFGQSGILATSGVGYSTYMIILMQLLFWSATLFFLLYIISFRSI